MCYRSADDHVGLPALDGLENVEMIQDVVDAAIVRQSIEKRSNRLLCLHTLLLQFEPNILNSL